MKLVWNLKKEEYEKFQKEQQNFDGSYNIDKEYIGSVRTGKLCFDIFSFGDRLFFELYVGDENTGYGYSRKPEYMNYPYDYCDISSFVWTESVVDVPYEDFIEDLTKYIEEHIRTHEGYVTDIGTSVDLIEKADADLELW